MAQAASGAEALRLFDEAGGIDLVPADFAMPGMNGAELRRQLLARQPWLRVAIVTGYADLGAPHDVEEDMALQKPVYGDQLAERLRKWLPGARRR